jgi:protoporphyrinogen oxidase
LQKTSKCTTTILEETDCLGGIATTKFYHGNYMDMGGHRFFTKAQQIQDLWKELLPLQGKPSLDDILLQTTKKYTGSTDPESTKDVFLLRRRVSRIYYKKHFFNYPITLSWSTIKNLGLFTLFKVGASYIYSMLVKRKERNLEDFYINRFGRILYNMFFENYTEKIWGMHPANISSEWGEQRVKGLSIFALLFNIFKKMFVSDKHIETSLIEEFYYPKYGPGQMWEKMAKSVLEKGADIVYHRQVNKIRQNPDKTFLVTAVDEVGKEYDYNCKKIISSMPIKDLVSSLGDNVPANVQEIAAKLPYRDFITVGLLLSKIKIKNTTTMKTVGNIVPDCWIYIQEDGVKLGRLQIFNNWSPYLVKDVENTVWIGLEYFCNVGDELWSLSKEDFIKFAIDEVVKIGIIDREDVLDATQVKVKKAYPAYFGTYEHFDLVKDYLNSIDNLYCIGRNGQHKYNNMDHSMLSGIEAINVILGKSEKDIIWKVNTEHEYHEQAKVAISKN